MKFLFLSETGDGLGLALRLKDSGHQVAAWIRDKRSKKNYDGLLHKPSNWQTDYLTKDTVVVFDSSGGGKTGDRLRSQGHFVFMGSTFADQLELDRDIAFGFMEQVGIKIPHYEAFRNWQQARDFVKRNDQRWVFKASGTMAKDHAITSYVSTDAEDMIGMLNWYESVCTTTPDFELQEFKEGVCISTEGWFNGEEFMHPFNHTVERKQVMNNNLGPSGGCSGNLVWGCWEGSNTVIEEGIAKMAPILCEFDYRGPIDLNTVVNSEGVWALEFTPRFGFDALPAFLELYDGDIGETLLGPLARNERPKDLIMKRGYGSALRVNVPPYPSEQFVPDEGVPIRGFTKEDRPHTFFYDVMFNERNELVTSGAYGAVAALTSHGDDPSSALDSPMRVAKRVRIPNKMYRTDLVEELSIDLTKWRNLVSAAKRGAPVASNVQ